MKINSILACVDASEYSTALMHLTAYVAKKIKAKLCALHVVDIMQLEGPFMYDLSGALGFEPFSNFSAKIRAVLEEKGNNVLTSFEQIAKTLDVEFERYMEVGVVSRTILDFEQKCDLLAIGRKGVNEQYERGILGTNIESILRKSKKSLLLAPRHFYTFSNVVACVDTREISDKVYEFARYFSQSFGIPLKCVYIDKKGESVDLDKFGNVDVVSSKNVVGALEEYIRKIEKPLVCMGAYAKPKIFEIVLGSTTENLLKKDLEVSYLVVK